MSPRRLSPDAQHQMMNLLLHLDDLRALRYGSGRLYRTRSSPLQDDFLCDRLDVEGAVQALPEADQVLVRWLGIDHVPMREAARRLGVTPQAVRDRLWRLAGRLVRSLVR